jgi:hypothetical protein
MASGSAVTNESLRNVLLEMAAADQAAFKNLDKACAESDELRARVTSRSDPISSTPAWLVEWTDDPPVVIALIQAVVHRNTQRMRQVIQHVGWPGRGIVGEEGAAAAWLIVHHADDLDLQRSCLPLLARAVEEGDAPSTHLEWLTDRVLLREGRPEMYGTHAGSRGDPPVSVLSLEPRNRPNHH